MGEGVPERGVGCRLGEAVVGIGLGAGVVGAGVGTGVGSGVGGNVGARVVGTAVGRAVVIGDCVIGLLVTGADVVGRGVGEKLGGKLGERVVGVGFSVGRISEVGCGLGSKAQSDVRPIGNTDTLA